MRLTVGPLPPAVYWRRRAIVLGALLFVIFFLVFRCGGTDASGRGAGPSTTATPKATATAKVQTPVVEPAASPTPAASVASGPCADSELTVTAVTEGNRVEFVVGTYVKIFLRIKNVSARSCPRDVGGAQQELRIMQGAVKLWSSDDCSTAAGGSDVRTLRPGDLLDQFSVVWNGRASTDCGTKPLPGPGTYQLTGRVGTKWSDPVTLTVKAR